MYNFKFILNIVLLISFLTSTQFGCKNKKQEVCMQKYSTVALVNNEKHPGVINSWLTFMKKSNRIINSTIVNENLLIVELRSKNRNVKTNLVEEKVYIFTSDFDSRIINDRCKRPITKILTFSRNVPKSLETISSKSVLVKDIKNEY